MAGNRCLSYSYLTNNRLFRWIFLINISTTLYQSRFFFTISKSYSRVISDLCKIGVIPIVHSTVMSTPANIRAGIYVNIFKSILYKYLPRCIWMITYETEDMFLIWSLVQFENFNSGTLHQKGGSPPRKT